MRNGVSYLLDASVGDDLEDVKARLVARAKALPAVFLPGTCHCGCWPTNSCEHVHCPCFGRRKLAFRRYPKGRRTRVLNELVTPEHKARLEVYLARAARHGADTKDYDVVRYALNRAVDLGWRWGGGTDFVGEREPGEFAANFTRWATHASSPASRAAYLANKRRWCRDNLCWYGPRFLWPGQKAVLAPVRADGLGGGWVADPFVP